MGATLLDGVNGLADVIAAHASTMEQERRIADEVVAGIRATGLNRALMPAALGGDDVPLLDVVHAIERIAAIDGSTGWCAAVGMGSNVFSGYVAPEAAAEVWPDPDQGNASAFGPTGEVRPDGDGLTLSGRWAFSSNCLHSDHITPLGMARGAVDEVQRLIADGVGSTRGAIANDPLALADYAMADTRLRAARAAIADACGRAWEAAERGERASKQVQAQVMLALNHGCEVAVEVTGTCHRLGGGKAAYAGSTLLRRLRDVETARQHMMFGFGSRPVLAKALSGEDIFAPPFIV